MKFGKKIYRDWHFTDGNRKWRDTYHFVSMNADMEDLETYKKSLLLLKERYSNDYFSTSSTFSKEYLKEKMDYITTLVQGLEEAINELEKH